MFVSIHRARLSGVASATVVSIAIMAALTASPTPARAAYTFTTFDVNVRQIPGSHGSQAYGISNRGEIVGTYQDAANVNHAFMYKNGVFTKIDPPDTGTNPAFCGASRIGAAAHGINNSGAIVGNYFDSGCNEHGFRYRGGVFTAIDDPNGSGGTYASAINDCGTIVGYYIDASGKFHGFVETAGAFAAIDVPNAGSLGNVAYDINDNDTIVGAYFDGSRIAHAYIDVDGQFTNIDDPKGTQQSVANKLNKSTEIVGSYYTSNTNHGFLYVNGVFTTLDDPKAGIQGTAAEGINDLGTIVGSYIDPLTGQHHGFVARPG